MLRYSNKTFPIQRHLGRGDWAWRLDDVRRVLYKLPSLKGRRTVYVVEGKKDADSLWKRGVPATTNVLGPGKWREEYTQQLIDAGVQQVVILPDFDPEGERHASVVARACLAGGLAVKIVALPGLPQKGDVTDWLANGGTAEQLGELVRSTPAMSPVEPAQLHEEVMT